MNSHTLGPTPEHYLRYFRERIRLVNDLDLGMVFIEEDKISYPALHVAKFYQPGSLEYRRELIDVMLTYLHQVAEKCGIGFEELRLLLRICNAEEHATILKGFNQYTGLNLELRESKQEEYVKVREYYLTSQETEDWTPYTNDSQSDLLSPSPPRREEPVEGDVLSTAMDSSGDSSPSPLEKRDELFEDESVSTAKDSRGERSPSPLGLPFLAPTFYQPCKRRGSLEWDEEEQKNSEYLNYLS